jgi:Holliday junction resolvasome RuvABC endonuclease subunit
MDPSFRNWGLAYFDYTNGVLQLLNTELISTTETQGIKRNSADIISCTALFDRLDNIMYEFAPDILVAEIPIGSQSSRAANGYGVCMALLGALSSYRVPMVHITPNQVKRLVGSNTASKKDVIDWVVSKHPNAPFPRRGGSIVASKSEHMADAIVTMHVALNQPTFKDALNAISNHT